MLEVITNNWNAVVAPTDRVYVLGDVVMGVRAKNLTALDQLNGNKFLIPGNHCNAHPMYSTKNNFAASVELYGRYFEILGVEKEIEIGGTKVLMCHFPAEGDHTDEERYREWRPSYDGWIMHGHLHCEEIGVAPRHVHVGIDADWSAFGIPRYTPIPEETVLRYIRSQEQ